MFHDLFHEGRIRGHFRTPISQTKKPILARPKLHQVTRAGQNPFKSFFFSDKVQQFVAVAVHFDFHLDRAKCFLLNPRNVPQLHFGLHFDCLQRVNHNGTCSAVDCFCSLRMCWLVPSVLSAPGRSTM